MNNVPVRITLGDPEMNTAVAVAIGTAMAALIGIMAHLLVFRPLCHASPPSKVIGSVGVMIYLQAVAFVHFGTTQKADQGWSIFSRDKEPIRELSRVGSGLSGSNLWLALAGLVVTVAVWLVIRFTRFGLAARAVEENERGIALLGYSPDTIAGATWVMSAVLAGMVGMIFVGFTQPTNMTLLVVPALGAALVGNLTSLSGAALGGVGIAMIQSGGVWMAGRESWPDWLPAAGVRQVVPLLIVIAVLFLRGDRLPVRGSLVAGGQPRAPSAMNTNRMLGASVAFAAFVTIVGGWRMDTRPDHHPRRWHLHVVLVVLIGFPGQISLAQWSLAGLAAFAMIRLSADGTQIRPTDQLVNSGPGLPDPLAAFIAVAIAVIVGIVIGLPAVRVRGFQLAIISITAVIAIEDLLLGNAALMGAGAISNNPAPIPSWFGFYVGAQQRTETAEGVVVGTSNSLGYTVLVVIMAVALRARSDQPPAGSHRSAVPRGSGQRTGGGSDRHRRGCERSCSASPSHRVSPVSPACCSPTRCPAVTSTNFGLFSGLGFLAFVYIAGITTVPGAFVGGVLVAGGLLSALSGSDSGSAFIRYTPLLGAFGLLVAARMANGEGVLAVGGPARALARALERPDGRGGGVGPSGPHPGARSRWHRRCRLHRTWHPPHRPRGHSGRVRFSDSQAGFLPFADVLAGRRSRRLRRATSPTE